MPTLRHLPDQGYPILITTRATSSFFKDPDCAGMIQNALMFGREKGWYRLLAYVVMPDHIHLVIVPTRKTVAAAMQAIKGFTSRVLNGRFKRRGPLWQAGYYDYLIDSPEKLRTKVKYLEENPVRARFCSTPEMYPFSSASRRGALDMWIYV